SGGNRDGTSVSAAGPFTGLFENFAAAGKVSARDYGDGCHYLAAGRGGAGRTHRPAFDSRVSTKAGKPAKESADSRFRARDESSNGGHCRIRRREHQIRVAWASRCREFAQ